MCRSALVDGEHVSTKAECTHKRDTLGKCTKRCTNFTGEGAKIPQPNTGEGQEENEGWIWGTVTRDREVFTSSRTQALQGASRVSLALI